MIRKSVKALSMSMAVMMAISLLAGCSSKNSSGTPTPEATQAATVKTPEPAKKSLAAVELEFFFPGDAPNQIQDVLDEVSKRTADTIATKLKFNWVPWGEIKNKIALKLAAGEPVDSVFDAPWQSMSQNISKGLYVNLDKYFNNDQYPGLKKAFPADYLNNNKMVGANSEYHVYGIPFTQTYENAWGIGIRRDLREKYGLPEIKNLEEYEKFLEAVVKNEKGIVPFGTDGAQQAVADTLNTIFDAQEEFKYTGAVTITDGVDFRSVINNEGKILATSFGDSQWSEYYNALPEPLKSKGRFYWAKKAREWYKKGYIEKDVMNQKNTKGAFEAGKFASYSTDALTYDQSRKKLEAQVPGAKVELFIANQNIREFKPASISTTFQAWNFACIPVTSKNIDRTMMFFDWLFADIKNHDLLEYGITGKNFEPVGDDKYKIPAGIDAAKNYNFPGYVLTWNPIIKRIDANASEYDIKMNKYLGDVTSFFPRKLAGFSMNNESVKTEIAKLGQVSNVTMAIKNGLVDDIEGEGQKNFEKQKSLGLLKVREEYIKQAQAWLDAKKK